MNINEIARLSGVSIGTVDRVLHKRGRVAKDTLARVERVIQETGYEPNALARQLKLRKPHDVGVLMPGVEAEGGYWQAIIDGMEDAIERSLKGFMFKIHAFKFRRRDRKSLYKAWEEMKNSDVCAYIIAPVMQEEMMCILKNGEGLKPYCFVDTEVPALNPLCTIRQNPYQAGIMAGKLTYLTSKRPGEFIALCSDMDAFNLSERARGFLQWMKSNGQSASCVYCEGEEELSNKVEEAMANKTVAGVCVVNSLTHIASDLICNKGLKENISVVGFDMVERNKALLERGGIDALVAQRPHEQGFFAMMKLYHRLVLQDDIKPSLDIPIDVYFKENVCAIEQLEALPTRLVW